MLNLTVTPNSDTNAWGRNGWFIPDTIDCHVWAKNEFHEADIFRLEVYSKRIGRHAPMILQVNRETLEGLRATLDRMLAEVTHA